MTHSICFDGKSYVVSPQFATAVKAALGTLSFNSVATEQERKLLQHISNIRPLSAEQRQRLWFLDHVLNVLSAITVVGEHHDPVKEWGFDGWDAVHGNKHIAECGCIRHYVFDHHSATNHFGHNRLSQEEIMKPDGSLKLVVHYKREHHEIEHHRCAEHAR